MELAYIQHRLLKHEMLFKQFFMHEKCNYAIELTNFYYVSLYSTLTAKA